jgi:hypothetical protein
VARIKDNVIPDGFVLSVGLDRYQELMQLPIAAFNGLNWPEEQPKYQCSTIWKQSERDNVAMFLAHAEEMRELELGYHIAPKYIEDEEHEFSSILVLDRKHLIEVGKEAVESFAAGTGVVLDLGISPDAINDPVEISVATTVTVTTEICVFYPGEDVKIRPTKISITGGVVTIQIPRSRLVKPSLMDDREDHLYYLDNDNFITTVDVKRCYTDPSDVATIRWLGNELCTDRCVLETQSACLVAAGNRSKRISKVHLTPATYSAGSWTVKSYEHCHTPVSALVSYKSGRQASIKTELLTARLAHTLMPNQPSSCPTVHMYWDRDTPSQDIWTPYGNKVGAFDVWVIDNRDRVGVGGMFS